MPKKEQKIFIPADIPQAAQQKYIDNYNAITQHTGKLMLFACDQKIEHLNNDFYGPDIPQDAMHPEHLFNIASQGRIGAMATHLGLIARYGKQYPNINYIIKLNAKTNLVPTEQKDPLSTLLWHVEHAIHFKQTSGLNICGVGFSVYLGSEYENAMLTQVAQAIYSAHQHGLITNIWMYPRGKAVSSDQDPALVAGAVGVANSLGADFVKVKPPQGDSKKSAELLKIVTAAAGNTKVICSGGAKKDAKLFLQELYDQITIGGTQGNATGRNIFQHSLPTAIAMTKAISAIVLDGKDVASAIKILQAHS